MSPTDAAPRHQEDTILVGENGRGIFLQALGQIRAPVCFPLREDVLPRLESVEYSLAVFVDLSACRYMDSTFIGLLVSMDGRLKNRGSRLHIHHPTAECLDAFHRLGLERILDIRDDPVELPPDMKEIPRPGRPSEEFILKTHEALMETSEEAKQKFGLLKEMLEKKIRRR
jgi:anti-anti-sigma factor